jgi:hypothetical protein
MRSLKGSIAITSCVLTLLSGVAFADNLHPLVATNNPPNPAAGSAAPGQTGANVLASCGPTLPDYSSIGDGAKTSTGNGSPFNPDAVKKYAGNPGNPATNPKAVSQYDNACAQASLHPKVP